MPPSPPRWLPSIAAGLLLAASQIHLATIVAPLEPNLVAFQLTFTAEGFWQALTAWGPGGIARFRAHLLPWDMFHPIVYGLFGYLLAGRSPLFAEATNDRRRLLALMLPVAAGFDYVENFSHLYLLGQPPGSGALLVPLTATCSAIKWALAAWFTVIVSAALIRRRGR